MPLLFSILAAPGCGKKAAPPPAPAAVDVAAVVQRDVPVIREWVGTLDGYVNAEIRPQIEGYVLRQVYREGSFVHRGDVLFEIDPRQFQAALDQARGDLARTEAALAKARLDVTRFTPLVAEKAVSQQELDNAMSARRQAEANVQSSSAAVERAQLNRTWTRVTSPIDGVAGVAKAQVGNLVSGQTAMTTVSQVDPIKAYFSPSEQEYLAWSRGEGLVTTGASNGKLRLVLSDGSEYPFPGDPVLQDRSVDPKTGTLLIAGAFPNPQRLLRPGQYGKVRAVTNVLRGALLVPQRAVSELQGNFQVAVVGSDDKVELRPVETGDRLGTLWVILKGLKPGERVVVEGLQKVKAGSAVRPRVVPAETPASAAAKAGAAAEAPGSPAAATPAQPPAGTGK